MLNFEQIKKMYDNFIIYKRPRLKKLNDYYSGKHDILNKSNRSNGDRPTKAINNYAKYITTTTTGYFIGNPISYVYPEKDKFTEINNVFKFNTESSHNADLALYCSIYGKAYELNYLDEDSKYCFAALDPRSVMVVKDGKIKPKITDAVVFDEIELPNNKIKTTMTIYDNTHVSVYEYTKDINAAEEFTYTKVDEYQHNMGCCPIVEYRNNRSGTSDYEDVISLIDSYNEAISTSIDDLKDFTDAFLMLKNLSGSTDEDVESIKDKKVIMVDGDGDAAWLNKNINDAYSENIKNRLKQDIHKFSFTPDLSEEAFAGNLSGVAIKCKFQSLEQLRQEKERWFYKGLYKRLTLINSYLSKYGKSINIMDLEIKFAANLPINNTELVQNVNNLTGIISHKTQLSMLPNIQNVDAELEQLEEEKAANDPYKNEFNNISKEAPEDDE